MILTHDEEYLLTTGCDGFLIINKIKEDGSLEIKRRFRISTKVSLENKTQLGIDVYKNIVAVSGGDCLRLLDMSNVSNEDFTWDSLDFKSEIEIYHKAAISTVHWFMSGQYLATVDVNNVIKIWNYDSKLLLFQLDHTSAIIKFQFSKLNNFFVMNDHDGSLLISNNKFNFKTNNKPKLLKKEEAKVNDNLDDVNIDDLVNDCANKIMENTQINEEIENKEETEKEKDKDKDRDKPKPNDKKDKRNLSEKMDEDLISLSQIEGEDGELKDASEIAKSNYFNLIFL